MRLQSSNAEAMRGTIPAVHLSRRGATNANAVPVFTCRRAPESLDTLIVQGMLAAERFWREELSEDNRDDWRGWWTTHPVQDVALREYVLGTPGTWDKVRVEEPRLYAWSQLYGWLYFDGAFKYQAGSTAPPLATIQTVDNSPGVFAVTMNVPAPELGVGLVMLYATNSAANPNRAYRWQLRFAASFWTAEPTYTVDIFDVIEARPPSTDGGTVFLRVGTLAGNNFMLWDSTAVAATFHKT